MLDWLVKNKEWFFSGVGIFLISLLGRSIYYKYTSKKSTPVLSELKSTQNIQIGNGNISNSGSNVVIENTVNIIKDQEQKIDRNVAIDYEKTPTPDDIVEEIKKQPLLLKDEYCKSYKKHSFCWQLSLQDASRCPDNTISVSFISEDHNSVYSIIDDLKYPDIIRKKRYDKALVKGEIVKIAIMYIIEVEIHEMIFLD